MLISAILEHFAHSGLLKFGIALEWGSRGLEFESRHSDQKIQNRFLFWIFIFINNFWLMSKQPLSRS